MSLSQTLSEYITACFTGLWIESHEHEDALREIAQLCAAEDWRLVTWNIESGLQLAGQSLREEGNDPLAAIRAVNALAEPDSSAILVLVNFHRFLNSPEIVQALAQQVIAGKQNRTFIVILSPVVNVPVELEKLFAVLEHELPSRSQLEEIARGVATEKGELPDGPDLDKVLDAACGLTRFEAENAFSLSLVRSGKVEAKSVWEQKEHMLKKSGVMRLYRGRETFEDIGGLSALKSFCKRSLLNSRSDNPLKKPRGVLLLSPPGCGKSYFCKALGNETQRPTLILDVGSLMGSLVGQSEGNLRRALNTIEAMGKCVVMIDELEKAFAGAASGGKYDSGVTTRLFGGLLTWLSDRENSDAYVVCTSNNISGLPPEFARAERFDAVTFLDLPSKEEKQTIWSLYRDKFELDSKQELPSDDNWTGAEVRACCRLAALLDLPLREAARNIVPVAATASESVENLRRWASGRCLSANEPGVYQWQENKNGPRRKIRRGDPSNN